MPLNGTDSKTGCAKSAQMGGKRSCLVVVRWKLGGGLMANFGTRAAFAAIPLLLSGFYVRYFMR
jgi:hypothetical protein